MALVPGTRLGVYEITARIGAGGMGEVYRATDTTLGRQVAIKILPDAFASDPDRLARFEREAKTLASINHPGIAAIYGVDKSAGAYALVMELVDGEDLARRIERGAMPVDEALPIARQIVDALEAAHDQGIVHRDLKPANIKIRTDGSAKVLDFGLAKALDPASGTGLQPSGVAVTNSPTLTSPALMTGAGMILGTAAYMAPEQARGRAVDRRADIWAFGAVLYEMLTGRRAFGVSSHGQDDDISMTLASVLKDEVKWEALPANTPASIRRLLRRCLERDPKRRLSAIGDARFELDDVATSAAELPGVGADSRGRGARLPWIALGIVTLLWGATLVPAWKSFHVEPETAQVRFSIPVPPSAMTANVGSWYPSISPDGQTVAFVAPSPSGGLVMIWLRPLGGDAKPLPGTEGVGQNLIWSPDSRTLAFASAGKLRRIDIAGGPATPICDMEVFSGGSWSQKGVIVFATARTVGALFVVNAAGGIPTEFAEDDRRPEEAVSRRWPVFLPDGTHFLYQTAGGDDSARQIYVRSIDGGAPLRLTNSDSQPAYAPGFLVFQRGRTLFAQPFDAASLRLSGAPRVIAEDVLNVRAQGRGAYAVSSTGVLVYRTGSILDDSDLVWVDRRGTAAATVGDVRPYNQIRLSPDEKRVALVGFDDQTGVNRVSVLELTSGVTSVLAPESTLMGDNDPLWAPTSDAVAFESMRNGKRDFFRRAIGSVKDEPLLVSPESPKWLDDWSPDGGHILFHVPPPSRLSVLSVRDHTVTPMLNSTATIDSAHFSHDGKWISYNSNESGEWRVSVASFPDGDHRQQISAHGGGQAWWRGDDREIFYLAPDGTMMSVPVTADARTGALDFHAPQGLFQSPIKSPSMSVDQYSVTRDGQRFLFIRPKADSGGTVSPLNVVINWTAGLK